MKRRAFIQHMSLGLTVLSLDRDAMLFLNNPPEKAFEDTAFQLLKTWCDAMLQHQIHAPDDAARHGALHCPACNTIHGRCMDAVLPFLYMAQKTGEQKYLTAGIAAFEWSKNVSQEDGSWTVMPDPKTWKGISVFGAIALAETLKFHGHLLPPTVKNHWMERSTKAGDFIFTTFDMTFTNINYGYTAVYALHLLGHVLHNEKYIERSRQLAKEIKNWLTEPHHLVFGEGKPSDSRSAKGLAAVDLGYNVEETLNGVVMYAVEENDTALIALLKKSLEGHLEFMLPDGAWDNSWGTRHYKWSYWGSRTTDGCQVAYTMLAHLNPAFGKAVFKNTELLQRCTANGLLHGGLHYAQHGTPPCIHHTFTHAKALTAILNEGKNLDKISEKGILPREKPYGVRHIPEVDVWLMSKAGWQATVSAYDFVYKKHAQPASGGAIGVLYHAKAGTILSGSMAKYMMVEAFNQQPLKENDYALTPRLEQFKNGTWYTNLYDLKATVKAYKTGIAAQVQLVDEDQNPVEENAKKYQLNYEIDKNSFNIMAKTPTVGDKNTLLTVPIVSASSEKVKKISNHKLIIEKGNCQLEITSNAPLILTEDFPKRAFNLVPGFEVLPLSVGFGMDGLAVIEIRVK